MDRHSHRLPESVSGAEGAPAQTKTRFQQRNCRICHQADRAAIEATVLNGDTYAANARSVSAAFGIKVSGRSLKNHIERHVEDRAFHEALEAAQLLRSMGLVFDPDQWAGRAVEALYLSAGEQLISGKIDVCR